MDTYGGKIGCTQAIVDGYHENESQLQQDKENCFKQYPQ